MKSKTKKTNFRWAVLVLLVIATTVNYFDRFLMGNLTTVLEDEIGGQNRNMGTLLFADAAGTFSPIRSTNKTDSK